MKKTMLLISFLVFIVSSVSFSQPAGLAEFKNALLEFEKAVKYSFQSSGWKNRRASWRAEVENANSPLKVAQALVALETSMTWSSVNNSWRTRRSPWIAEARSARTVSAFARLLLELENVTLWKAVYDSWRAKRPGWVSALRALQ